MENTSVNPEMSSAAGPTVPSSQLTSEQITVVAASCEWGGGGVWNHLHRRGSFSLLDEMIVFAELICRVVIALSLLSPLMFSLRFLCNYI